MYHQLGLQKKKMFWIYTHTHTHTKDLFHTLFALMTNSYHFLICAVIFSVMPFDWFICIYLSPVFMGILFFIYASVIYTHFFRNITGALHTH